MKKSTGKVIIVALVLITIGIGLFIGGIFAVGGIAAAKEGLENTVCLLKMVSRLMFGILMSWMI